MQTYIGYHKSFSSIGALVKSSIKATLGSPMAVANEFLRDGFAYFGAGRTPS